MSFTAAHESKHARRNCHVCRDRKARFRFRGEVRADREHVLCFECFRSERNRQAARRLADEGPPQSPFGGIAAALTARQIAHRSLMLGHLATARK